MAHPMSMPWLDWRPIRDEPRGYEDILYIDDNGHVWTGNHPDGCARGRWSESGGGASDGHRDPILWARIPLPAILKGD